MWLCKCGAANDTRRCWYCRRNSITDPGEDNLPGFSFDTIVEVPLFTMENLWDESVLRIIHEPFVHSDYK